MRAQVVPMQSSAQAVRAELRSPGTLLVVLATVAWLGFWACRDAAAGDGVGAVTGGVLGVVLGADTFHRAVRRRRGLTGTHPLWPVVAGAGMAVLIAVAGIRDPALGLAGAAVYVAIVVAVLAALGALERRSGRRSEQGQPTGHPSDLSP